MNRPLGPGMSAHRRGMVLGAACLVAGAALVAHAEAGAWREALVQRALGRSLDHDGARAMDVGDARVLAAARLVVEPLGLDVVAVVPEPGSSSEAALGAGPVVQQPLEGGPLLVSGHRDTHMRALEGVREGQEVVLRGRLGERRYRVTDTRVVDPDDTTALAELGPSDLLVSTCYPFRHVGPAPQRFLVLARGVGLSRTGSGG